MVAFSQLACHLRYALIIVCVLVIVILFSKWTGSSSEKIPFVQVRTAGSVVSGDTVVKNLVVSAKQMYDNVQHQLEEMPVPSDEQRTLLMVQLAYALAYVDSAQMSCADISVLEKISGIDQLSSLISDIGRLQTQLMQQSVQDHSAVVSYV